MKQILFIFGNIFHRSGRSLIIISLILLPDSIIAQNITTIAGTGTQGYNGDGILATTAQLNCPQGLAVDAAGNIYITDLVGHRIRKVDISTGLISTIAGTGTSGYNGDGILATSAQICAPSALAFDGNGDLYFTDRCNGRVRKITISTGIITTVAGTGGGGYNGDGILATAATLNAPNDVAFDASDNMYIADWQNYRVRKVDKITGIISTIAGTGTAGYNGDGIIATIAQINAPCGIIFDNAGNIYIAELSGHRIRKITISTGLISTIAGTGTAGYNGDGIAATSAQLNFTAYIRFDAAQNMYIGDAGNQRVRKIDRSTGIISTIAGTGTGGYNGDGILATTAQLNTPWNVYFDKLNCNMYIAEYNNQRIRKITGGFTGCPSPVAPGNLVSCQVLPAVAINNANKNSWVPVFDNSGNIAAEINANGNILGMVNTSLFTKTGACRIDGSHRIYLNRNITITPQNQPSTAVSVRLYILKAELDSLKTALNDLGQPSGVASINDVDVFKNSDACATVGSINALPLSATTGTYNSDYYLQVSISSFSSFYFANKLLAAILPVKISSFKGIRAGSANILQWQANCSGAISFNIERSSDGIHFEAIGDVPATAADCNQPFGFTDHDPLLTNNYYRLRINEAGTATGYSNIILLPGDKSEPIWISMVPDPVNGSTIYLQVSSAISGKVALMITDIAGRIMLRQTLIVQAGSNDVLINAAGLASGIYWLYGFGEAGRTNVVKFVKQ